MLLYLYYRFDNGKPALFVTAWRVSDWMRRRISGFNLTWRRVTTQVIAASVYWPLARLAKQGERIFAYLNRKGIIAAGRMGGEPAYPSRAILREDEDEWNRNVEWKVEVKPDKAVTAAQARLWGYNLPTLAVLGKMSNGKVAEKIANELEKRA